MASKASSKAETKGLSVGDKAPTFSLKNSEGKTVKLSDFKGQKVVVYFYPKDDTPGCTKEACGFRDDISQFNKKGIEVVGISPDDTASHQKFATKYDLPFTLLADPSHEVAEKYGVWAEKNMYGKKYWGIKRTTFVVDEDGRIQEIFGKVNTDTHSKDVLNTIG
ncbi:MAG TPA: thioredoxin-dependent thiol peroxidase [Blastocatellia bacterium]|nr:thioredoxin-dependent thiol peroxidase [Blastocatellia bacterium]